MGPIFPGKTSFANAICCVLFYKHCISNIVKNMFKMRYYTFVPESVDYLTAND